MLADVKLPARIILELSTDEFRLVMKSLDGRLKGQDVSAAAALAVDIGRKRRAELEQRVRESQKLMDNITEREARDVQRDG